MYCISDQICGDKCAAYECKCGNETFSSVDYDPYYCCIPKNESCEENQKIGICQAGQMKSIQHFCQDQGQCPIATEGYVALTSNCSSNHDCPSSSLSSRICIDSANVSLEFYCKGAFEQFKDGIMCPNSNKGLSYQQCYQM